MLGNRSMKPVFIIAMALIVIVSSALLPYAAYSYENRRLSNYGIHYQAEPVTIKSSNVTIYDKLSETKNILENSSFVYVSLDDKSGENVNLDKYDLHQNLDEIPEIAAREFVSLFITDDSLSRTGYTKKRVVEELLKSDYIYRALYLMIETEDKDMFMAWNIIFSNGEVDVDIVIDDETGKLLALNIYDNSYFNTVDRFNNGKVSDIYDIIGSLIYDRNFEYRIATYYDMEVVGGLEYAADELNVSKAVQLGVKNGKNDAGEIIVPYSIHVNDEGTSVFSYNYFFDEPLEMREMISDEDD